MGESVSSEIKDIIIIGAGAAGLTAAIYAARAGMSVLVLEAKSYGGQIINSPHVENYPGILSVSGYEFATGLYEQAKKAGAFLEYVKVESIHKSERHIHVFTAERQYRCSSLILATGAKNRPLELEKEQEWVGSGVSYCATCDGAFFKGKEVAVVGGGNTALEEVAFLSNICTKVYLIHRRDAFRGEEKLAKALGKKENVEIIFNATVTALHGEDALSGITVSVKDQEEKNIAVSGLFISIGQMPDNKPFSNVITLDKDGYIVAGENCKTNVDGIFAAGDCRTKQVRQLTTAAADGAIAALSAIEYINQGEEHGKQN